MLEKIIDYSLSNRMIIIFLTIVGIMWGIFSMLKIPVDAIPDLSDVQVIVYTEYPGQSPQTIEDQITYPITTALSSVPHSTTVRGFSNFGYSLVYILFEDGTDVYWARSRVLEYLTTAQKNLPEKVIPVLGPSATSVGWVYEYVLSSPTRSLEELKTLQDFYLKYELTSVPGVAEVASVGGFSKQHQVQIDPIKLKNYGLNYRHIEMALKNANRETGGEVIELGEKEFMIRAKGYLSSIEDIKNISIKTSMSSGISLTIGDLANVVSTPTMRRGIAEWNGEGEVVGGIIIMRYGENALDVISNTKAKIEELKKGLPEDIEILPAYDRSNLIHKSIRNLSEKLILEIVVVGLICIVFLLHARSTLVALFSLPAAILISFIVMDYFEIHANIMSLGGIAIAIGTMIDAAIIMIENMHKHMEKNQALPTELQVPHWDLVHTAVKEVGPSLFWSLALITVSFLPVFALQDQAGRLFKPLAYTKTLAMASAALLSITIIPILMGYFVRGKILPEKENPINRFLISTYHPVVKWSLNRPYLILSSVGILLIVTLYPMMKLGGEFMPPLWEGDLLYMPTTQPGVSITKSRELLQQTDKIIRNFPEVESVFGKAGRAETATDPAGLDMLETTIILKDEKYWRQGMTREKLIEELNNSIQFPGLTNSWTMPIKTRIDMLSTGMKTPIGIKISGANLDTLSKLAIKFESILSKIPTTRSVFAERPVSGNYVDVDIDREKLGRYGLTISDVHDAIQTVIAGMKITTMIQGLERYPITLRLSRDFRDSPDKLAELLIPNMDGVQIPLKQIATINLSTGPMMIRTENSRPNAWVFIDISNTSLTNYLSDADKLIQKELQLPIGYSWNWSGDFQNLEKANQKLAMVIPLTIFIIILILFINTKSWVKTGIVLLAVPFSLIGAFWFLFFLDYHLSVAVWVGLIALAGLDAETGVIMLLYLDHSWEKLKSSGKRITLNELKNSIDEGAVQRVRPKLMTALTIIIGLFPVMWSDGIGSDVMKRIAAPMVGGVVTSLLLELLVYPVIYFLWKKREVID